jgi:hypothetical protein
VKGELVWISIASIRDVLSTLLLGGATGVAADRVRVAFSAEDRRAVRRR